MITRRKKKYFDRKNEDPAPLIATINRRVLFREVDLMKYVWFGRYPSFFDEAANDLCQKCGLTFNDFYENNIVTPVAQYHIDYHLPLFLDENISINARMIWTESSKLNYEYEIIKEDGSIGSTGYSIQLFVKADSGTVLLVPPEMIVNFRKKWKDNYYTELQN